MTEHEIAENMRRLIGYACRKNKTSTDKNFVFCYSANEVIKNINKSKDLGLLKFIITELETPESDWVWGKPEYSVLCDALNSTSDSEIRDAITKFI